MTWDGARDRQHPTLVDLLRHRAAEEGGAPAYTFLADGEAEAERLTYAELDRQARALGAALAGRGLGGERALLLYPPGLEFIAAFLGCLYAGVVAVPAYPPRSQRGLPRLLSIVQDARPRVVLTTGAQLRKAEALLGQVLGAPEDGGVACLATDQLLAAEEAGALAAAWTPPAIDGGTLAFLQYTSGSTSAPKGVMVSHGNLLHNEEMIRQAFGQSAESVILGWLPVYHDMGLIGNVLQPLYVGAPCILMSPVAFLQKPLRWLEAISRYRATTSGGPNFAYALCAQKVTEEQKAGLDLSSWRVAFNGAEPVRAETLDRFAAAFAPCGFRRAAFYPCYGLAEATLFVTGGALGEPFVARPFEAAALERDEAVPAGPGSGRPARELVGCGHAWAGQRVEIVDPAALVPCAPGRVGEVWVAGPSVARGYWGRPDATERDFHARLADEPEAGPFLRTGDLGFVADGELYVTGRLKDLVILRGRNHYPQDLELTAERAHPALRPGCGAAFAVETEGEERLVVVQELERRGDGAGAEEVAAAIRRAVAEEHEVQVWDVVLLRSGTIPKTSSGKIQRHACRNAYLKGGLEVVGRSALETAGEEALPPEVELGREALLALEPAERPALLAAWLRDRVARLLRTSPARVDPDGPLTALGLDSLAAVELKQTVESALGVQVSLAGLLEGMSTAELAAEVAAGSAQAPAETAPIEPSGVWTESPLSYGQKALWFLQRLSPESAAYHITAAVRVAGDLDVPALHRAFQGLVDRHPALRATFSPGAGGDPVQRVRESMPVGFVFEDAEGLGEAALTARLAAEAYRPFDLENGPLLRAGLFRLGGREHALVLAVHHIAADFWSLAVAFAELARLYEREAAGEPAGVLAPLPVTYGDYIRWQDERLAGPEGERLWSYWREALAGPPADLDLPADRPRPPVQTDRGSSVALALGPELTARVHDAARGSGSTLFMTLLAAFQALLHRWSGQEDFAVGSPVAGRGAPELAGLVGYFVDPVVLRADLSGGPTFAGLLGRVRRAALGAFEHQGFPFQLLTERLQPARDPSRSPLFQAMLILQKAHRPEQEALAPFALGEAGAEIPLGPLALSSIPLPDRPAQLDLTLMLAEGADGLGASFQFNADLFDAATVERMAGHFRTLLAGAAAAPATPVRDLPLLTPEERAVLVTEWNATAAGYPRERLVHELFEEQADRTPERPALVHATQSLTYLELERRANQLAHHLMKIGVGPEVSVGVHLDRSPDLAVGVLGVLKTGAGYLPLDPAYPEDRVAFMLEDAGVPVVLTQERLEGALAGYPGRRLRLDADWGDVAREPGSRPPRRADPDGFAYLIYTSGSTGRPKGVQVRHRGVVNFIASMARQPGLGPDDVLVAVTTLSFDIAGLELYLPWMTGARVVLAGREEASDGTRLLALLRSSGATVMQATPSTWRLLIAAGWEGEPRIKALCGGEALPRDLAAQLLARAASVWNLYGPTETTIWSAVHQALPGETTPAVSLGRPIANTGIFIVDPAFRPVPVGVPGELLIGGDGLARGYFRRPELTADRFVPDAVSGASGERLYRTGDLARWRAGGTLEFLGRLDHQVKIRGHRVELGEIEAALSRHPAVRQGVVVARQDASGGQRLVAYVVADGPHPPAPSPAPPSTLPGRGGERGGPSDPGDPGGRGRPSPGEGVWRGGRGDGGEGSGGGTGEKDLGPELRRYLAESLPEAFVPSLFVTLPALPLTPNGKVDRKALPAPDLSRREGAGYEAPRSEIERAIAGIWKDVLGVDKVGLHDNFFDLGGHSLLAAQVHARLRQALGRDDLTMVDLFRHPTVAALARHLRPDEAPAAPAARERQAPGRKEVAIVSMAGRFPGAPGVADFWRRLRNGEECIAAFSDQELIEAGVSPSLLADPAYVKAAGVVDGAETFDAPFFGFSPREAEVMDPQHRVFLECAWEALESAGYDPERYPGRIGVFAGVGINTYLHYAGADLLAGSAGRYQAFIANDKDFVPTRVSYKLNLKGPSVNVQTACSTSLVALHLACQSLAAGDCDMALVGGVSIRSPQKEGYLFEEGGILSPDGHCRAFDADSRGTVFGNGVGLVVVKRLDDALADGDTVHAVIKGTAINNDGSGKVGYTAPSVEGQARVIADALAAAGVDPETVTYVEAHGTGTALGDPIEVAALSEVFGARTRKRGFCALGSVKTNIGHLDTAAGIAGLIKTVQSMRHGELPPSLHFQAPNPRIDFASSPFYVNAALAEWPADGAPRRAGVSSFGIGGTNAHVVLEEAPALEPTGPSRPWQLLTLSARTPTALDAATRNLARSLAEDPDLALAPLADIAYTLDVGRRPFAHRRAVVCRDREDAVAALADPERWVTGQQEPGDRQVVFLFSGQGSQYPDMGRELYETEPVFRQELDACAELLAPHLSPQGSDLREVLYPDLFGSGLAAEEAARRLDQTALTQPALFAVEYALARLWMSWGVQPAAMLGHSIGEYVAACLAGVFGLADALALVAARGRLMQSLPPGAMLGVDLHEAEVTPYLGPGLSLAAVNGPSSCAVSGPEEAVAGLERRLAGSGVRVRRLHTSHAFHSAMMDPILAAFTAEVAKVHRSVPRLPWVSNLTGTWITPEDAADPGYWSRHLRGAVRFADGVRTLLADSDRVLLEVGPGHTLATLARQAGPGRTVVSSLRHPRDPQPDGAVLLRALGRLWLSGAAVDWSGFWSGERRRRVPLPTYPFERQRYWLEPKHRLAAASADRLARKDDVADWFYAPVWRQAVPLPRFAASESASRWLLLAGDGPGPALMSRLAGRLQEAGCQVTLDTSPPEAWEALLASSREAGALPHRIVHAWNLTGPGGAVPDRLDAARRHAFDGLVLLAQALERSAAGEAVRIGVLSNGLQRVGGERVTHPEKALLLGPVAVVPQEVPNLSLQSLDLVLPEPGSLEEEDLIDDLLAEMAAPAVGAAESVVAFRGGERWVRGFGPVRLEGRAEPFSRLREGGVYLVTGGLGGLGLALAEELAGRVRAKLVLTGRRALPPRADWEAWTVAHGEADEVSARIRKVRALEAMGAEVETVAADVTDPEAVAAAVRFAQERFGALHGVVHAAGLPGGGIVHLKTPEAAWRVMAPKVQGTLALDAALAGRDLDFLVLCSSINAAIGGFGQSDYAAANAFLDAYAQAGWRGARRGRFTASIAWDRWEEVGMAARSSSPLALWGGGAGGGAAPDHPLLDACLVETPEREVYRTTLSPERHWVLSEHWIAGRPTVPGTTYLEMARAAFARRSRGRAVELREVVFLAPLALQAGQTREVLTLLEKDGDGFVFRVVSKTGVEAGEALWQEHARGRIDAVEAAEPGRRDVAALLGGERREVTAEDVVGAHRGDGAGFLVTGPRWQSLKSLQVGDGESLAVLELDEGFAADLGRYELHPALLDVAAGAVQFLAEGNFLPLTYERLRLHGPLARRGYSHFRLRPPLGGSGGETITCDITLLDEEGRELVEIEGFSMRRVSDAAAAQLQGAPKEARGGLRLPDFDEATEKRPADGISPHQGREAFLRVLREGGVPHVVVSTRDLEAVIEDVAALTRSRLAEELGKLSAPSATHARPEVSSAYTAPADDFERQVAEVWERVLGIERVGVHDNFFELGGTSLTGIQLVTELKKRLNVDLPTVSIFEAPTVAALARYLKPASGAGGAVSAFEQTRSRAEKKKQALQQARKRRR